MGELEGVLPTIFEPLDFLFFPSSILFFKIWELEGVLRNVSTV
jgi:hypothetical protein